METLTKVSAFEHPIKSVTIFKSSKAEIVRTFAVKLEKGANRVEVHGLSSSIDRQSVRVSGLDDARLFDVVCTVASSDASSYSADSPEELIRTLSVKKTSLESKKRIRELEADLLVSYAKTLTGEHITPVQMSQFLESFIEQGHKNLETITALDEKIIETDRLIKAQTQKKVSKKGAALGEVEIVIHSDKICQADLKLTYIVSEVHWKPTYELYAKSEGGKPSSSVSLHYRALVTQSTGEDWKTVSLILSTNSSDAVAKSIPGLASVKIKANESRGGSGFWPLPQLQGNPRITPVHLFGDQNHSRGVRTAVMHSGSAFGQGAGGLFGSTAPSTTPSSFVSFGAGSGPDNTSPQPIEEADSFVEISSPEPEPSTIINETPIALSYSVHGPCSIPSDGMDHQVSIAVLPFEGKISYISVPRLEPRVYLQCQVKNSSEYKLLRGPVSVMMDDSFVSKTSILDIGTGDTFDCTLGDDSSTSISYARTSHSTKVTGGAFSEAPNINVTTYTTRITVQNKHAFALSSLVIREVIPMSDDKRIKVVLKQPEGLADAKDGEMVNLDVKGGKVGWSEVVDGKGGEKEGKFEWRLEVGGGEKVVLEAQWEVRAPVEITLAETVLRN